MKKGLKIVIYITFAIYLIALIGILFLNNRGNWETTPYSEYIQSLTNLIPFKTINEYIQALIHGTMNLDIPIRNLASMLLLYLPFGIYVPLVFSNYQKFSTFLCSMSLVIILVEILQLITRHGSLDIDDFILNLVGTIIGFTFYKIITKFKFISQLELQN